MTNTEDRQVRWLVPPPLVGVLIISHHNSHIQNVKLIILRIIATI